MRISAQIHQGPQAKWPCSHLRGRNAGTEKEKRTSGK